MSLGNEKYLLLTTFKRSGDAVATPVWAVDLDSGDVGFWTSSQSGKAKRLRHTSKVTVQPCNSRGRPNEGTSPTDTTARLVAGDDMSEIRQKVVAKYGFQTKITKLLGTVGGTLKGNKIPYGDQGVIIKTD